MTDVLTNPDRTLLEGTKFDEGKPPMELIPYPAISAIAKVLAFGAGKYKAWNWSKGMAWSRLIGAAERHLGKFKSGLDVDEESGLSHLAHAGCCIVFLLTYQLCGLGKDDRYKGLLVDGKLPED